MTIRQQNKVRDLKGNFDNRPAAKKIIRTMLLAVTVFILEATVWTVFQTRPVYCA